MNLIHTKVYIEVFLKSRILLRGGVEGAGEAGAVGAPAAVVNAIVDALHPSTGVKHLDMPLAREKVWRALQTRFA